jgi:hypothetical protein
VVPAIISIIKVATFKQCLPNGGKIEWADGIRVGIDIDLSLALFRMHVGTESVAVDRMSQWLMIGVGDGNNTGQLAKARGY